MVEKQCFVCCYNCRLETKLTFQVLEMATTATTPTIEKSVSCQYCGRLNITDIPESWDAHPLVLGDRDVVGYREGLPILEGRRV
jgi:hypothetical protein